MRMNFVHLIQNVVTVSFEINKIIIIKKNEIQDTLMKYTISPFEEMQIFFTVFKKIDNYCGMYFSLINFGNSQFFC